MQSPHVPIFKLAGVAIGAIITLISLALPWYSGRYTDFGVRWLFLPKHWKDDEPLVGLVLPVVFVIIFASFAAASVLRFLLKGKAPVRLLRLMGILAIVALVFNAAFYSWYVQRPFVYDFESGFILALIGSIIVTVATYIGSLKAS